MKLSRQIATAGFVLAAIFAWLWLWKFVGEHTWSWGRVTFWILLAIAALLVAVNTRAVAAWLRLSARGRDVLIALLTVACVYLAVRQERVFADGFGPRWAGRLWDVSQGAYDFNQALLRGENPYRARAQYHPAQGRLGHSSDAEGREYLFGWRYYYGYPHFPMSALWFMPFMGMTGGYNDIRIANLVYFILNFVLLEVIVFLACRRWTACLLAAVAFLGVDFLVSETAQLGIVDQVFSVPLLAAILLAMRSRWRAAGVFAGLALASKHFPASPVVLALAIFVYRRGQLRDFAVSSALTVLVVVLPFVLWDYEAFVSATVLWHLHEANAGDNTALYFFLPETWRTPFKLLGALTIGAAYVWDFVEMRQADVRLLFLLIATVCLLINAFYPVLHLNHLEPILAFASISFALGLARSS